MSRIALFFPVFLCGAVVAQDRLSAPSRVGVSLAQTRLTVREAIELALRYNLEVEIEKTTTASALATLRGARGPWDPSLRWLPGMETRNTPAASALQGAGGKLAERFHSQNFYFHQRTPWNGASVDVSFENSRQSSSNPFLSLSPFITSRLLFTITQPLLRGRVVDRERTELRIKRKEVAISETQMKLKAIDVIMRVQQAYWDLVAARQDMSVKADTVEWARQQLARNTRMIDAGTLAPVELSASSAELERRLDDWYASIGIVTEVENGLKLLISDSRSAQIWGEEIVPAEEDPVAFQEPDDAAASVKSAVQQRPELDVLRAQLDVVEAQKTQSRNALKPQVNVVAGYGQYGLSGAVRPGDNPITASSASLYQRVNELSVKQGMQPVGAPSFGALPDAMIGGYGSTLSNLFGGNYQSAQVGISFDLTFRNSQAESALAQNAIAERRLKLLQAQAEQLIQAQVRNALQALQSARHRIQAAEAGVRAAKEKFESEQRLFQTGESTNFLVLTRQNEYTESRRRLLFARVDFNKAVARYQQALGSTLREQNVTVK